ncbi:TPA: ABC transporter ATP-binding protein [Clostridium botulinum]|nr:ABC transporter ATP-binding protein [Clostridium botulinum]
MHINKQLMCHLKKYKLLLITVYIVCSLAQILELIPIYIFGTIVDFIIKGNFIEVKKRVIYLIIIFILFNSLNIIETLLTVRLRNRITNDIKEKIVKKTFKLQMQDFNEIKDGQIITTLENDSSVISSFITDDIPNMLISTITIIISLFLILKLSLNLSIIALVMIPISMITSCVIGKFVKKYTIKGRELSDNYSSFVQEFLTKFKEIRCLSIQNIVFRTYNKSINNIADNVMKTSMTNTVSNLMSSLLTSVTEWIIIIYGAWLIINKYLTVGTYVAFNSYLSKFSTSLQQIFTYNIHVQALKVSLIRINNLFEYTEEEYNKLGEKQKIEGEIILKDISFSFKKNKTPVLNNLNLIIPKNSFYVIVGTNGSGKTTLLNILIRLYRQTEGSILVDNNPIDDINLRYLRENIIYIQQDSHLFNISIKENLSILNKNSSMTKIIEVCKLVGIHSYIDSLPNKYDSIIGKKGINLSGGQKSRLIIARALLKNPKIMLFDEITSELDAQSEMDIMEILKNLSRNHTILMVAHRINAILAAQKIIVMDKGSIVGFGTHNKLISNCENYKNLFLNQINDIEQKII